MLFSAAGISVTVLTLLVANPHNTISQIINLLLLAMSYFIYVGSILFASITEVPFVSFSAAHIGG
jgi:hypothetical protein